MLAKPEYLSATELQCSEPIRAAFIQVYEAHLKGKIDPKLFDMSRVGAPECGTPGCLMGWARTLSGHYFYFYTKTRSPLTNLCLPTDSGGAWGEASLDDAVSRLHDVLTTGNPDPWGLDT